MSRLAREEIEAEAEGTGAKSRRQARKVRFDRHVQYAVPDLTERQSPSLAILNALLGHLLDLVWYLALKYLLLGSRRRRAACPGNRTRLAIVVSGCDCPSVGGGQSSDSQDWSDARTTRTLGRSKGSHTQFSPLLGRDLALHLAKRGYTVFAICEEEQSLSALAVAWQKTKARMAESRGRECHGTLFPMLDPRGAERDRSARSSTPASESPNPKLTDLLNTIWAYLEIHRLKLWSFVSCPSAFNKGLDEISFQKLPQHADNKDLSQVASAILNQDFHRVIELFSLLQAGPSMSPPATSGGLHDQRRPLSSHTLSRCVLVAPPKVVPWSWSVDANARPVPNEFHIGRECGGLRRECVGNSFGSLARWYRRMDAREHRNTGHQKKTHLSVVKPGYVRLETQGAMLVSSLSSSTSSKTSNSESENASTIRSWPRGAEDDFEIDRSDNGKRMVSLSLRQRLSRKLLRSIALSTSSPVRQVVHAIESSEPSSTYWTGLDGKVSAFWESVGGRAVHEWIWG